MPRALEPGETFPVVLDCDKDKPKETQPRFIYRSVNCREFKKITALVDKVDSIDDLLDAARIGLVGWENMVVDGKKLAFNPDDLDLVLDLQDAWDLVRVASAGQKLSAEDKKKLGSEPSSSLASSVADAAAANAEQTALAS